MNNNFDPNTPQPANQEDATPANAATVESGELDNATGANQDSEEGGAEG